MSEFAERLKQIRLDRDEHQKHAALKIGIMPHQLFEYESGRHEPGLIILIAISDYYHVSTDYLLGRAEK